MLNKALAAMVVLGVLIAGGAFVRKQVVSNTELQLEVKALEAQVADALSAKETKDEISKLSGDDLVDAASQWLLVEDPK